MRALSFRTRLALAMCALILLISVAIWVYLPNKLEEEAIALIAHKAETLAQLTAFTIHPAVYFQDRAALEEALSGTRQDKDVAYVIVTAGPGGQLAAFHPEHANAAALARQTQGGAVSPDGTLYEVMAPIREKDRELARLYIGISLARLNRQIMTTRLGIGAIGALIIAISFVAVILVSDLLTRPLRQVAKAAHQIAAGDLDHRLPITGGDEIGQLAGSFNEMASRVAERDASLRQSHEQLRVLSKRLLSVQEQERVRIAREVHDELGQALTALKIDLQQLGMRHRQVEESLRPLAKTIDGIIDLVRRIATDLRPAILDDLGIAAALEQQLRRVRESTGMKTTLTISEEPSLDMLTGVTLYRIAQEGLSNVMRHAGATEVEISLEIGDGTAELAIRDNGRGISSEKIGAPESLGLIGIRERAELLGGSVNIEGRDGAGTTLTAILPLLKDDQNAASTLR
jgi:signal transduction histidine kinase